MIGVEQIEDALGLKIHLSHDNFLMIVASRGYLGCGYLDLGAAEEMGDVAATVTGVATFDDILDARIREVTTRAKELGIQVGMSGKEALQILSE